jgi:HEAT repeat protein
MPKHLREQAEFDPPTSTAVTGEPNSATAELIQKLSSPHVPERERARTELVALGRMAFPELQAACERGDGRGRLEACKALTEIADPAAVPTFIRCLEGDQQDLRWVAAEGLSNIGGPAIEPLLMALIDRAAAHTILDGAVHALRGLARRMTEPILEPVIAAAVRAPEPGVSVPLAAETALSFWREMASAAAALPMAPILPLFEPRGDKAWYDRRR